MTVHYLCDLFDGMLAIYGLPPETAIPTPPYDGDLRISPFAVLLVIPPHFLTIDDVAIPGTIPNDPALSGVTLLLQALVGPSFRAPKDATWTNCATLAIR